MRYKVISFLTLLLAISVFSYAQEGKKTGVVKGKLLNGVTKAPFSDVKVAIPALNVFTSSDGDGNFDISEVPYGSQTIVISKYNINTQTIAAMVDKDVVDLG